jgi:hypothetical protein
MIAGIAVLVVAVGGTAVVYGPKFLSRFKKDDKPTAQKSNTKSPATTPVAVNTDRAVAAVEKPYDPPTRTVSDARVGSPITVALPTGSAWTAQVDPGAKRLVLAEDFRLPIAGESGVRFNANSVVLAPSPSPFIGVAAAPESDRSAATTIEVWNLSTKSQTARFKINRPLAYAALSPDGAWYAGQAHDDAAKTTTVEVWSTTNATSTGQPVYAIPFASPTPPGRPAVLGFPGNDRIAVLGGGKLQVHSIQTKPSVREWAAPASGDELCAAVSGNLKYVAIADAKSLTLVDLSSAKPVGALTFPEALPGHARRPLSVRAVEFSPDGTSLAVMFDNRSSARRIAVVDVASGRITAVHTPAAPVYTGGPELQWLSDGSAFLVGSGVLLDRRTDRQIGQIFTDLADEGLGGSLVSLVGRNQNGMDRALIAWDKLSNGLVVRAMPVRAEAADWVGVSIGPASTALYDHLQCVSRQFGNLFGFQSMPQIGRLADKEAPKFLVVNVEFMAAVAEHAPDMVPFRPDQFSLVADGVVRQPIGTLATDGSFTLEPPEYNLRKYDRAPRKRAIVFAASGKEKSLALRIANKEKPLGVPAAASEPPTPALTAMAIERLSAGLFTDPDDTTQVTARVIFARLGPYVTEPDAAEHLPLALTYEPPAGAALLAVQFEIAATAPRTVSGRGGASGPPKPGLLLPDGTHLRPVIELPGLLPVTLSTGEKRTHTCLFLLPATANRYRLTYENLPVAMVKAEAGAVGVTPPG